MEEEPSDAEVSFFKSEKLPQSLAGLSALAVIASGISEQIPNWVPFTSFALMLGSLVYVSRNEIN
jgi:hypothetical protein